MTKWNAQNMKTQQHNARVFGAPNGIMEQELVWESKVQLGNFSEHMSSWRAIALRNGLPNLNQRGVLLFDFF